MLNPDFNAKSNGTTADAWTIWESIILLDARILLPSYDWIKVVMERLGRTEDAVTSRKDEFRGHNGGRRIIGDDTEIRHRQMNPDKAPKGPLTSEELKRLAYAACHYKLPISTCSVILWRPISVITPAFYDVLGMPLPPKAPVPPAMAQKVGESISHGVAATDAFYEALAKEFNSTVAQVKALISKMAIGSTTKDVGPGSKWVVSVYPIPDDLS